MRGKAIPFLVGGFKLRITPAYAGKSVKNCGAGGVKRDHPRVCGEKTKKIP